MSSPAILVDHVTYSYGAHEVGRPALADVSFEVARGASVAVVGQTGSGKSTLARLVCALEPPDSGRILVGGADTATRRGRRALRGRVGYVMQRPERQLFAETVRADVAYGPTNLRLPADEVRRRVDAALGYVGLADRADDSPFALSGGQRRLCALAGVLAMEPDVIVLDEPTAGLDPRGRGEVRSLVSRLRGTDATIVQVTHSMEDAALADRVVVLDQGALLLEGEPGEVFSHGEELSSHGLGVPAPLAWARALESVGVGPLGDPLNVDGLADAVAREVAPCH